jgi:hypothetical protein
MVTIAYFPIRPPNSYCIRTTSAVVLHRPNSETDRQADNQATFRARCAFHLEISVCFYRRLPEVFDLQYSIKRRLGYKETLQHVQSPAYLLDMREQNMKIIAVRKFSFVTSVSVGRNSSVGIATGYLKCPDFIKIRGLISFHPPGKKLSSFVRTLMLVVPLSKSITSFSWPLHHRLSERASSSCRSSSELRRRRIHPHAAHFS